MNGYKINIKLESNCLLGSGEGWGSVVDTDIVFDSVGLPYFPARRLKGCIRESANEVLEMLAAAKIENYDKKLMKRVFGNAGDTTGASVVFNNLHLPEYEDVFSWCNWAVHEFAGSLSPEVIVNTFTEIRQQTSINEKGVAEDGSLRTFRVLKAGLEFEGNVILNDQSQEVLNLLTLACSNLRRVGTMRNRGYGKVTCTLKKEDQELLPECIAALERGSL